MIKKNLSVKEFIAMYSITMSVKSHGWITSKYWFPGSRRYTVTLKCEDRTMSLPFKISPGMNSVEIEDVLEILISEAEEWTKVTSFKVWSEQHGFTYNDNTWNKSAHRAWDAIKNQSYDLYFLLGHEAYDRAINQIDC